MREVHTWARVCLLFLAVLVAVNAALAEPIRARYKEGCGHSFLRLRGEDGETIAIGETLDTVDGSKVTSRLTFRFRDGSVDDDTTVFDQSRDVRLISDHHIQQGPSYPHPLDVSIDVPSAQVTIHDLKSGKAMTDHLDLPADVGNGVLLEFMRNIANRIPATTVSYVALGSKPRLVKLVISPAGQDTFSIAGAHRRARKYEIKVDLGGVVSVVAPIIGKQPKASYVWMLGGKVPAFLKMQAQLYEGGPVWTIEQASPAWSSQIAK